MEIRVAKPPVWDNACAAFQVNPKKTVFTYGNVLYNPSGAVITDDILAHEKVHSKQQNHSDEGAALWWGKYLRDPLFRLDQEAKAYGAQYRFLCKKYKDRNLRARILFDLATFLSGPLYGKCITYGEAYKLIKTYAQ